jgi:hypothetical protein
VVLDEVPLDVVDAEELVLAESDVEAESPASPLLDSEPQAVVASRTASAGRLVRWIAVDLCF